MGVCSGGAQDLHVDANMSYSLNSYLEGQGDYVSRLITPISHIIG